MTDYTGISEIDTWLDAADETTNKHGNRVRTIFIEGDRYFFDQHLDLKSWHQFDTAADAPYFGVWTNPGQRRILSFAEGDVSFTQCPDDESYDREIAELCSFHEPAPSFVTIRDGEATAYYQDRAECFIDPSRVSRESAS